MTFDYVVSDGNGGTDTGTVNGTINPINDDPTAVADAYATNEDTALNIPASGVLGNDSDIDGDTITVLSHTAAANGTVVVNGDGSFTYTPNANFNGSDTFTYTVSDGNGGTDTATVTITVNPVNDAPVANDDAFSTDEDTPSGTIDLVGNDTDVDGDTLSVQSIAGTTLTPGVAQTIAVTNGTVNVSAAGVVTFTPDANYNGPVTFDYVVSDGNGGTDTGTVNGTINPINDDPTAVADAYATNEDTALNIPASGVLGNDSDIDGDTITVLSHTAAANGTVVVNGDGSFTYTPNSGYNGFDSFTYTISDGNGGTDTATVTINIGAVNDPPIANDDAFSTDEDTPSGTIDLVGNDTDVDGDTLSVQSIAGTTLTPGVAQTIAVTNGTVNVSAAGVVTFTPDANYNGPVTFDYVVSDGNGGTDTGTVNGTINPINDDPTAVADAYATNEDTALNIPASGVLGNDSDIDGDTITVLSHTAAANGTVVVNGDGSFTYTPNANFNGSDTFTYTVSDGNGGTDTATVTITVNPVNDAPVANDDAFSTDEDTPSGTIDLVGNDTDVDGDTLSVQSIAGTTLTPGVAQTIAVTNGTVNVSAAGVVTFTPDANYNGPVTFDYVVSDGNGGTDTGTVNGTINPINDDPTAVADAYATNEDTALNIPASGVLGNDSDIDGDTITVLSHTAAANGTVVVNGDGSFTYTPNANFNGSDTFTYTVSDGNGGTDTATVTITVNPVNDAPVANDDAFSTDEDTPSGTIDLVGNDTDVDGDTLSVQSIAGTTLTPGVAQTIAVTNGTVNVSAAGVVTFTPDANYNGTVTFDYVVSDGNGGTDTGTVNGTINPINDDPTAVADAYATNEDTTLNIPASGVLGNDSDIDGDTITVLSHTAAANGTVVVNGDGSFTYTPNANFNGSDTFTYTVSDGNGGTDTATVTITVNPVNDAPVANDDAFSTDEDTPSGTIDLVGNDTDVDGDTLSVQSIAGTTLTPGVAQTIAVTNGTVNVSAAGVVTFTPDANYNGPVTFDYVVSDGNGGTDTGTVNGTINPINDDPTAVADAYATNEDTALNIPASGVLGNDSDIDGDTITVLSHTAAANGTVVVNGDGSFTYTPNANFNGSDTFTYTVSDGNGGTDTATVTITVNPVNDAPVANDDAFSTDEDTPSGTIDLVGNDTDVDGDTLSVQSIAGTTLTPGVAQTIAVTNGTVNVSAAGVVTFTPDANYNGPVTFDYVVSDGNGGTDTGTVNGTINPINDDPTAVADAYATNEDTTLNIPASGVLGNDSDIDGDTITVLSHTAAANGTVVVNGDGSFTYTPNANFNGSDTFTYTVSDGNGGTDTATVTITVNPVNDAPVANDDAFSTDEDTPSGTIDLVGNDTDVDGDTLSVQSIAGTTLTPGVAQTIAVTNGTVNVSAAGVVTFTPDANYNGTVTFDYVVSDGNGGTDTGTVNGTINPINDDPTAVADAYATNEDTALNIPASGVLGNDSDIDGDTITVLSHTAAANGTVVVNGDGSFTYTPNANFNGSDTFTYTVSDGNGGTDTATVTITVNPVNDAPVANDDAFSTDEDTPSGTIDLVGNDTDVDGDTLSVQSIAGTTLTPGVAQTIAVTNGTVNVSAAGVVTFTPDANYNGPVTFDYVVSDGNGGTDTGTVNGTINPINDDPTAVADAYATNEDTTLNIPASGVLGNDSDIDGDTITVLSHTAAANGTVVVNGDGSFTYTPNANFNGSDTFTYTVSDGNGGTDTATVTITVNPVNDAPVANDDAFSTDEDTPSGTIDLVGNDTDVDGDTLSVQSIAGTTLTPGVAQTIAVTNGTVNVSAAGVVTFTPDANYNGPVTFDYVVSDGNGGTDTGTVNGTINPINDDPTAVADAYATNEDTTLNIPASGVLGNDSDIDGDTITVLSHTAAANGTVVVNGDGSFTYTPNANFNGSDTFTYTVSDGNGGTDTATVTITVNPVNDAPVANDDAFSTDEDTPSGTIDLVGNDTDVDGDTLSVQSIAGTTLTPGVAQTIAVTNGTVNVSAAGVVTFTPDANYNGPVTFDYVVSDGNGGTDTGTVNGTINPINDDPTAVADAYATNEDTALNIPASGVLGNDSDIDGDTITVLSHTAAANGTVVVNGDGSFTYTPNANFNGSDTFTYTVSDGNGGTDTATVTITVNPVNDAPVANDDAFSTDEDTPSGTIDLVGNDTDVDGDTLSVQSIAGTTLTPGVAQTIAVTNGTVNVSAAGVVTFTPDANYNGPVTFDYVVSDGNGGTDTGTVNGTINPINDAPVANPDTATTPEDTPVTIDLLANDSDPEGGILAVTEINGTPITTGGPGVVVTGGVVTLNPAGTVTFTPNPDFNGSPSFTYTVEDVDGGTGTGTATVTVTPVDDAPTGTPDSAITSKDTPVTIDVLANDNDPDGDPMTITGVDGTPITVGGPGVAVMDGVVTLNSNGTITFTPDLDFIGTPSFTYTAEDPAGTPFTAAVSVSVQDPVSDADINIEHFDVVLPPDADYKSTTQKNVFDPLEVDGIIIDTVEGLGQIQSTTPTTAVDGIVVDTVNAIDGLGGTASLNGGVGGVATSIQDIDVLRAIADEADRVFGRITSDFDVHSWVGFTLRMDVGSLPQLGDGDTSGEIVVDTLLRKNVLHIQISNTFDEVKKGSVSGYKVMLADGRPLPEWMSVSEKGLLLGEVPADSSPISLKIMALHPDGTVTTRFVTIYTATGEVKPYELAMKDHAVQFSQQLQNAENRDVVNLREMDDFLAGNKADPKKTAAE